MSHTIFSLLKIPIVSHKPLRMGVQPRPNISTRTLLYCDCKSNSRFKKIKQKTIARKMSQSFGPFQFYTRKILYPRFFFFFLFSPVVCYLRKVIRHMTSDFDVCEVDLNEQMSFLNAGLSEWYQGETAGLTRTQNTTFTEGISGP